VKEMIEYGSFEIDLDLKRFQDEAELALASTEAKITGSKGLNRYYKIQGESDRILVDFLENHFLKKFGWHTEYFNSGEPAGLHTDGAVYKGRKDVVGVIIPLKYECENTPHTVLYDRIETEYKKLMFGKGEMRYRDTGEVFKYRDKHVHDPESLKYNPKGTAYYKQYADLKVHSAYKWEIGTMLVFDTLRWHSSSWFLSTPDVPDQLREYKRSIIAFGDLKNE